MARAKVTLTNRGTYEVGLAESGQSGTYQFLSLVSDAYKLDSETRAGQ
ncbi:MAG: hypothetical protein QOJ99_1052 [Bryobacterales bacterium]|nr:hypothetical protein [Bryobacterales bacterium]